jgi:hypothetical protein
LQQGLHQQETQAIDLSDEISFAIPAMSLVVTHR